MANWSSTSFLASVFIITLTFFSFGIFYHIITSCILVFYSLKIVAFIAKPSVSEALENPLHCNISPLSFLSFYLRIYFISTNYKPITAKELAQKLGLSETAVSMALNNKPGVSTKTRQEVIHLAEACGYDFTRIKKNSKNNGSIYVISYKAHNAILSYAPIFDELFEGIKKECQRDNYKVKTIQFYEKTDSLEDCFADLRISDCAGIILIGTEMRQDVCKQFLALNYPIILLDTYFDSLECTSVHINNVQGAYCATDYLIGLRNSQPGYLQSTYTIPNFKERFEGYTKAIKENGMSPSRSIVHKLSPSIENAMADMLEIIDRKDDLASSYFADNDMIAIGALKAFKLRGYKVPEEISIIGFDNISESRIIEPALTTMDVPRLYIGQTAAKILIEQVQTKRIYPTKIEISAKMVKRFSHCI